MAALAPPPSTKSRIVSIRGYLAACGGRDVLRFEDMPAATEASRTLRERFPDLNVSASYDRVTIQAK